MTNIDIQTQMLRETAELGRTLGHMHRLSLLETIAQGERSVERLAELTGLSVANASQHLQHLRRAGFVQTRRDGKRVLYRLGDGPVLALLAALRQCAEHKRMEIGEFVNDSLHQRNRVEGITRDELLSRMGEDEITLLDVRPEEEYALGHLPGAMNIPLEELESRLAELPPDHEIVAYCRGPYCVLSVNAVTALRARGLQARRLEQGFLDWRAAGLSVEMQ